MSFIVITAIAQFLNSIVSLLDKFIVTSKQVPKPALYVFYTGIFAFTSVLIFILDLIIDIFYDVSLPSIANVTFVSFDLLSLVTLNAITMLLALYFLYKALCCADASDVVPVTGSISAFFTLLFSFFLFGNILSVTFFFGFILLVVGTSLVSRFRFDSRTLGLTLLSGFIFSINAISLKIILNSMGFDNGFFWMSFMLTICALSMLVSKDMRANFVHHKRSRKAKKSFALIFGNKALAGISGILIIKAVELGDVSIVQALTGLQFLFLFVIASIVGPYTHVDLGENIKRKDFYQKMVSISIIFVGFVLLFI